jgi:hypothetical protein
VFFFPGGMASRLMRATQKYVDGATGPAPRFNYDTVWMKPATLFGGAMELAMYRDSTGSFRDKGDHIIIADEALNLAGCFPHTGLIIWAQNHNIDLFVFPWDWRRRLDETVKFFLGPFLTELTARAQAKGCPDPLARCALVGHSFGGMIANLILRSNAPIVGGLTHVITVGTPFYGYDGQVHRWFEGESYLNGFGLFEQLVMEMIATLPACYTLHFLDEATFNDTSTQAVLLGDAFPIPGYPSMDATTAGVRADPYNPQTNGSLVRYPGMTGFDYPELAYGKSQFQALASHMDPVLLQKFHNIRGVQTGADGTTPVNNTIGSVTWDWILPNFDAADPSPIKKGPKLPGDGTQPAWTAFLAANAARCVTVKGRTIDHMFLMNDTGVLEAIQAILCPEGVAVSPSETSEPEPASDDEIVEFMTWLSQHLLQIRSFDSFDDPKFVELISTTGFADRMPNIARRFISDVMKRPGPDGLRPPRGDGGGRGPRGPQREPPKTNQS